MRVAVIGGGAAGFFAALSAKHHHPEAEVFLFEKSEKLLSKVRISGGGRCNVTHHCLEPRKLAKFYPRGEQFLRKAFDQFAVKDTIAWFGDRGVQFKVEPDGRMFPTTNDSGTIIHALMQEADRSGVRVATRSPVSSIQQRASGTDRLFRLSVGPSIMDFDRVIITTGGNPRRESYDWLRALGHTIVEPVPSLFTFNMPAEPICELMGVSTKARVRIVGTSLETTGPLLVTHWGLSGPAVLRCSAWGARELSALEYRFTVQVNWLEQRSEDTLRAYFHEHAATLDRKLAENTNPFHLPKRLWSHLLAKAEIPLDKTWGMVARKERNRLIDILTNDRYQVEGKTTFKEEFVTAGGVSLDEVDPHTMESFIVPGIHFAGEVLDVDGITGGFNFQAAWTTGYLAGKLKG